MTISPFERAWYGRTPWWIWLLLPLSALYTAVVSLRRVAFRWGMAQSIELPVPVLVVGNFTVGGTGKTPLVAELARRLARRGQRPGIVCRGYGGKSSHWPRRVQPGDDPSQCGDEAVLLARKAGCPVAAGPRRSEAARLLIEEGVTFILTDDGLQHYALARDAEIAVKDGSRGYGNGFVLPVGPLRERPDARPPVDLELVNGEGGDFTLTTQNCYPLGHPDQPQPLSDWAGQSVHAVAAIGNPGRFFETLSTAGVECLEHPFPDHHAFALHDFEFAQGRPIFMTEKDAVKCESLQLQNTWVVPVEVEFGPGAVQRVEALLDRLLVRATQ